MDPKPEERPVEKIAKAQQEAGYCCLRGEVDLSGISTLESMLTRWIRQASRDLIVDLRGLSYLDASALHLLIRLDGVAREFHHHLYFLVSPFQRRLLQITKLDRMLLLMETAGGEPVSRGRRCREDFHSESPPRLNPLPSEEILLLPHCSATFYITRLRSNM